MTFRLSLFVIAIVLGVASSTTRVTAQSEAPQQVAGRWNGQCSNCPVRRFILVMRQNGEQLTGILQAVGRSGLGENEMPLVNGRIAGRTVTFRTVGADGMPLDAELRLSGDGTALEGQGRHRAAFGLKFTRAQ